VSQTTIDMLFVIITIRSFPHSWLVTGLVTRETRQVPLVEHRNLPEHPSLPLLLVEFVLLISLVFCVVFCWSLFVILSFFLSIVLSILSQFTVSEIRTLLKGHLWGDFIIPWLTIILSLRGAAVDCYIPGTYRWQNIWILIIYYSN
jgi:hypothetical protein